MIEDFWISVRKGGSWKGKEVTAGKLAQIAESDGNRVGRTLTSHSSPTPCRSHVSLTPTHPLTKTTPLQTDVIILVRGKGGDGKARQQILNYYDKVYKENHKISERLRDPIVRPVQGDGTADALRAVRDWIKVGFVGWLKCRLRAVVVCGLLDGRWGCGVSGA